nr:probable F-actin-capping protein subunit beta [Tanacetum cinerariifolium]
MKAGLSVEDGHMCNMRKMIEELEGKLRNQLDQVYFGKTKEMVCTLRPPSELLSMTLPDSRNPDITTARENTKKICGYSMCKNMLEMEENDLSNDDCEEIGDELFNDSDDKPVKDDHGSNLGMDSTQQD